MNQEAMHMRVNQLHGDGEGVTVLHLEYDCINLLGNEHSGK